MNCKDVQQQVFYNTQDLLPKGDKRLVEEHLDTCADCKAVYQLNLATAPIIKQEQEVKIAPFLMTRIEAKLEGQNAFRNNWKLLSALSTSVVAAGFILGVFINNLTIQQTYSETQEHEISYLFNDLEIESFEYKLTNN